MITLNKEEFEQLNPLIACDYPAKGGAGYILDSQEHALKIYHVWNNDDNKSRQLMSEREKRLEHFFCLPDCDVVIFPRELVYIGDKFAGFSMRNLKEHHTLSYEIYGDRDISRFYCNLKYIVDMTIRLQNAIKGELHQRGLFIRDFVNKNFVFADGKTFLVDVDSYIIGSLEQEIIDFNNCIKNDIYFVYHFFLSLIVRQFTHRFNSNDMNKLLNNINFDREHLLYFKSIFNGTMNIDYIDDNVLEDLSRNYHIISVHEKFDYDSECVLRKK